MWKKKKDSPPSKVVSNGAPPRLPIGSKDDTHTHTPTHTHTHTHTYTPNLNLRRQALVVKSTALRFISAVRFRYSLDTHTHTHTPLHTYTHLHTGSKFKEASVCVCVTAFQGRPEVSLLARRKKKKKYERKRKKKRSDDEEGGGKNNTEIRAEGKQKNNSVGRKRKQKNSVKSGNTRPIKVQSSSIR